MSEKDNELPVGDASHLLDNEPKERVESQIMPVPVAARQVTPDGDVVREAQPGDKPVAVMPGELVRLVSSKELQADVKRAIEPCPLCQHFDFPDKASHDYRMICAMLSSFSSNLPTWMQPHVPGRNPDEYGICKHPHGRVICVHLQNSCAQFKKRMSS